MQILKHSQPNIHIVFDEFEKLYAITSTKQVNNRLLPYVFNDAFESVFDVFSDYADINYPITYKKAKYKRIRRFNRKNRMIVCFSGGKDSTATALYWVEQGYEVYLYHLKGINKTYKDEWKSAEIVAKKLNLPLIIEEIELQGNQDWVEHPLKNMIIANMALQYGIRNKITCNISFGNFSSSTLDSDPFEVCGGDCKELWDVYKDIMGNIISNFKIFTPLVNFQDSIDTLLKHMYVIPYTQSCIGAYRYREYLHENNQKKYGIELYDHRCGSCWKCCSEYCILCDNDIRLYNESYYKHCLEILRSTLKKEHNVKVKKLEGVWDYYFFYDISKSKYFKTKKEG